MTLPVHGTSDYTVMCHVFKPGIEPGSTVWKSRKLTTQPPTHIYISLTNGVGGITVTVLDLQIIEIGGAL